MLLLPEKPEHPALAALHFPGTPLMIKKREYCCPELEVAHQKKWVRPNKGGWRFSIYDGSGNIWNWFQRHGTACLFCGRPLPPPLKRRRNAE
jgi:hypothetical protein